MTVWINWSDDYLMWHIDMMQGNERSTFFVVYHDLSQIKFILRRINVTTINLGTFLTEEQKAYVRQELSRRN